MYDKLDFSSFMYSESDFYGGEGDLFPLPPKLMGECRKGANITLRAREMLCLFGHWMKTGDDGSRRNFYFFTSHHL